MGRGPIALCAVALLVSGCGGSDDAPTRGPIDEAQRTGVRGTGEAGWASRAELVWLGDVADWSAAFAQAGGAVGAFESGARFDAAVRGDERAIEEYERVLAPIRRCGRSFERRVGTAPTPRLAESEAGFRDSCAQYRRGVDLMVRAVSEQDEGLADEARDAIERGGKEASAASGLLPPGEKRPLHRRREPGASRVDPTFSEAASLVADKDVEARCWAPADWRRLMVEERAYTRGKVNASVLGFASAGGARLNLAPRTCRALDRLAYRRARPTDRTQTFALALAVATLAHESIHASGIADEQAAECHGLQWLARTAEQVGVDGAYAKRLADTYWAHYDQLPAVYRSSECRDGGELDLDEGSSAFP
jgi:hypothetical protein